MSAKNTMPPKINHWLSSRFRLLTGLLVGLNLVCSALLFDPKLDTGGDNAAYINLAGSMLNPQTGFATTFAPGEPKPHTLAPFGYPLLLSPLIALFGQNILLLKFFSVLLAAASVLLFCVLIRPLTVPLYWLSLCATFAVNPLLAAYSHLILSEVPYLFFSLLSLWLLQRSETENSNTVNKWFWLAILCLGFTAHIRSIGLALPLAAAASLALRRHWRRLTLFSLSLALLLLPWMGRNYAVVDDHAGYGQQFLLKYSYDPEH